MAQPQPETVMPSLRPLLALAALSLAPLLAQGADTIPARKPGLWEIDTEVSMVPGQKITARRCIGPNGDGDLLDRSAKERKKCGEARVTRNGQEVVTDMVCKVDASTATIHGVLRGDFQKQYAGRVDTTYAPPLHGMSSTSVSLDARWIGPCAPGQKPGDTEMTMMGGRINLQELMKVMPMR